MSSSRVAGEIPLLEPDEGYQGGPQLRSVSWETQQAQAVADEECVNASNRLLVTTLLLMMLAVSGTW
jgi:hypothetical protein